MRQAARVDRNQPEIVAALRDFGCTVQILSAVGKGCPDILVGFRGDNVLLEIKDGEKPPNRRRLTNDEKNWHENWRGQVAVVNDIDEAIMAVVGKEE